MADRGSRGRSPIFYHLISNIKGVKLVKSEVDSIELTRNSHFVATITGSVALEAALMGKKAIVFGEAWYSGCPNTYNWQDLVSFEEFNNHVTKSPKYIEKFLKSLIQTYGIPMINNGGQLQFYEKEWLDSEFLEIQLQHTVDIVKRFLIFVKK